jgi:hypothetical protein
MAKAVEAVDSTTKVLPKRVVVKSPKWPAFTLPEALAKARIIYNHEKRNPTTMEVMMGHLGLKIGTGSANRALAALRAYGLIDRLAGGNYVVSDRAWRLLVVLTEDSPEREQLMREAAMAPTLFKEIANLYPDELPSDATMRSYLLLNKGFNENSIGRFLEVFKAALAIAKSGGSDYTPADADGDFDEDGEDIQVQQQVSAGTPTLRGPTKQELSRAFASKTAADLSALGIPVPMEGKELRFNISRDSEAQVIFRGPVTQEAIDKLAKLLDLQKDTFPTQEELDSVSGESVAPE